MDKKAVWIGGDAPSGVKCTRGRTPVGLAYIRLENKAVGPSSLVAARCIYRALKSAVLMTTGQGEGGRGDLYRL